MLSRCISSFFVFLVFASSNALAHPGHDHNHWLSHVSHAATYVVPVCILFFLVYISIKKARNDKSKIR